MKATHRHLIGRLINGACLGLNVSSVGVYHKNIGSLSRHEYSSGLLALSAQPCQVTLLYLAKKLGFSLKLGFGRKLLMVSFIREY
jgi:hypothetical protein